jgi:hypothetical protein
MQNAKAWIARRSIQVHFALGILRWAFCIVHYAFLLNTVAHD